MESNVFEDLEIPIDRITDKEYVKEFTNHVLAAAKKLESIMDEDSTVTKLERDAKTKWDADKVGNRKILDTYFKAASEKLYEDGETMDLHILYGLIQDLRRLAHDMELQLHDRAKRQLADVISPLQDKKVAQISHKKLRDAWSIYANFAKGFFGVEVPKIRAKPGNYTPTLTDSLIFRKDGSDYYNPRVICNKIGIDLGADAKYMDYVDFIEENPGTGIDIIKVPL